jgi:hypothetical protein
MFKKIIFTNTLPPNGQGDKSHKKTDRAPTIFVVGGIPATIYCTLIKGTFLLIMGYEKKKKATHRNAQD